MFFVGMNSLPGKLENWAGKSAKRSLASLLFFRSLCVPCHGHTSRVWALFLLFGSQTYVNDWAGLSRAWAV
jgi:hypothetical protein